MKFENIKVFNFEGALRGMRNPKNSWHLSDSCFGKGERDNIDGYIDEVATCWANAWANQVDFCDDRDKQATYDNYYHWLAYNGLMNLDNDIYDYAFIGPKDMKLAAALISGGSEHRKFLRQIMVTVDITAPLYWWKEFDTYKVGTTANSTSTMHKITSKPITLDCFEIDDYDDSLLVGMTSTGDPYNVGVYTEDFIDFLENLRLKYLETNDKRYWKELIRWLPNGWLQTRTVTMNYENLLSMVHQREHHKLTEWSGDGESFVNESFIKFAKSLPYANEFIFCQKRD